MSMRVQFSPAYIGAQVEIAENSSFGIEYQHTAAADAFVVSLLWRF